MESIAQQPLRKKGILLVNLGTPKAPTLSAVRTYLTEFLTDPRVIDFPWLKRQLLVRGVIIPFRLKNSTASYKAIWQNEGSPLEIHTKNAAEKLQKHLGDDFSVRYAMRYPASSCKNALLSLLEEPLEELIILPLFPQYASSTTGSIAELIMGMLAEREVIPKVRFINDFYEHPGFIRAFASRALPLLEKNSYDHVLFSFHGLPVRQLKKADRLGCCAANECCRSYFPKNRDCYAASCYRTAQLIACELKLPKFEVSFQSRLGKDPWISPFTSERLEILAAEGKRNILVFCPSFVADCLETLFEIEIEYQELFKKAGGDTLTLVPSLNSCSEWIEALASIALDLSCAKLLK